MTRLTPRIVASLTTRSRLCAALGAVAVATSGHQVSAQTDRRSSIVIAVGQEATVPIPTLKEGAQASTANTDVADQIFLHLAQLGPTLITSGDAAFEPLLARSWTRRDSVTLAFDLDARATWQDGVPVTSEDVVFTFARARDRTLAPRAADAAPTDHLGDRRGRPPGSLSVLRALWRAAVRCRLSRGAVARPSAQDDPACVAGHVPVRAGADRKRTVSMGAPRAGTISRVGRQRALLPGSPGDPTCRSPPCDGRRRPAESAARRRGRRNREHSAAPYQHRTRGRRPEPARRAGAVADARLPAVQSA